MNAFDELELLFKSGNSVSVERATLKLELFEKVKQEYREVLYQRNLLMQSIANAAFKSGIINGEVPLDGPQCLMVLEDMAEVASMYESLKH
jgi:hypothetical protein